MALKVSEKISNANTRIPKAKRNWSLFSTPNLFKNIQTNLDRLLIDKEISYEFVEVENAPLVGAAIAAISL